MAKQLLQGCLDGLLAGVTDPFVPNHLIYTLIVVLSLLSILTIVIFYTPWIFLPPDAPANPMVTPERVKPEWYFLASYQILKIFPSELLGVMIQVFIVLALFFLPFWDKSPERNQKKRPLYLWGGVVVLVGFIILTFWGLVS